MNRRKKLLCTISALILAVTLMGFGVYAATSVTSKLQSSISFISKDIKCTFSVDVDGGKYLSGGVGTNEEEYRHKSQSVNNESVNAAHTLDEFVMGHYTFDPTTEVGKKITYTITITNNGSNEINVKYTATKKIETIANILQVTETNMQSVKNIAVGESYIGKIELALLDSSADIEIKDIDITYEVSKALPQPPPTPLSSFTLGTPSNGTVSLTKFKGTETEVVIPSKDANGNLITTIKEFAFSSCSKLISVIVSNSVIIIEKQAFYNCTSLTNVSIPSSVNSIDVFAFSGCNDLTDINVEEGNSTYSSDNGALLNKDKTVIIICPNGKTSYIIPNSVTSIGNFAFGNCIKLKNITIPLGVKNIGVRAFYSCTALSEVTIAESVTNIESGAFYNCNSLTSLIIPDSVLNIGQNAFESCKKLKSIKISNNLTTIESDVFSYCSELTSINIPSSVVSIKRRAFYYSNISSFTNGINVLEVGLEAFDQTDWYYNQAEGLVYFNGNLINYKGECPAVINLKSDTVSIADYAFNNGNNLVNITIPNGVKRIGDYSFAWTSLESLSIPGSVKILGENAFSGTPIASLSLEYGLTTIGFSAFNSCSNLKSVTIPSTVTSIGASAFRDCGALTSVEILNSVTSIPYETFSGCSSLKNVSLGNGITSIEEYAFSACRSLTALTIPSSVKSVGGYAFCDCDSLTSLIILPGLTIIEDFAFTYAGFTSITLPNTVNSIGRWAFSDCRDLTSIIIPSSVENIGEGAFNYCNALESIYFERTSVFSNLDKNCLNYIKNGSVLYFKNETVMNQFVAGTHYIAANTTKALY